MKQLVHGGDWMGYRERFGRDALDFSANVSPLGLPEGVARCENSTPEVAVSKGKVGGIGLVNIQRRLGLLYPGRYELKQIENENKYTVILSITL